VVRRADAVVGHPPRVQLPERNGADIGCDVAEAGLAETKSAIEKAGYKADFVTADVTRQQDVETIVAAAGPRIDILANVAGIMDHFLPLGEVDDATWDRVLAVNLTGVMRLSRAVIPVMLSSGKGSIVTVASEAALGAGAAGVAYTASKHGVIGLVKSIAYFYGPRGIRSNAVLPGAVITNIATSAAPRVPWAMERAQLSMATMPAPAQPDEIAAAISWLASDEASNVNGATMTADGGWSTA